MIKRYRTAWPHVTVKIMDEATGKPTVAAFGAGVIVPLSADPDDVKRLTAKGALVAEPDPVTEKADADRRLAVKVKADAAAKAKADAQAKADKEAEEAAAAKAAADTKAAEEKAAVAKPAAGKADSKP